MGRFHHRVVVANGVCCFGLSEQLKSDLMKEVAYTRRKLHQASLQYYCALNALQYRKRIAMLEPMLGYTHAQVLHSFCTASATSLVYFEFSLRNFKVIHLCSA